MNRKELLEGLSSFEKHGKTSEELNILRIAIFDALDTKGIQMKTKDTLLKSLYQTANMKGIFFLRVMDRIPGLPKNEEEEREREEEEEVDQSYEPSYDDSYEEDEEEEEKKDEQK